KPGDFEAKIFWGDGGETDAVITQPGGAGTEFIVTGTYTYSAEGAYPLAIEVTDNISGIKSLPVSNVTSQQQSQVSPSIAIDPSNSNRVFAVAQRAGSSSNGISIARSEDGGASWATITIADGSDGLPIGAADPRVAI